MANPEHLTVLLLFVALPAIADSTPVSIGDQFQVNTYTTDRQAGPAAAADGDGDLVVVWTSFGSSGMDSSFWSVQGQLFDSMDAPVGDEFEVNTYTTGSQGSPAVATDGDGDFVVVWSSDGSFGSDLDGSSIQAQRFDSVGAPVGDQFQVNTYTTSLQFSPAMAVGADGEFVVVWTSDGSNGSDSSFYSIQGAAFDAAGAPIGDEFQVNTYTTSFQAWPAVTSDADGNFVVVWTSVGSSGSDSSLSSVQGQRFDHAGASLGRQFQVNTYTTDGQSSPSVAAGADGKFVVVWQSIGSSGSDSSERSVQGQRFDSAGTALGGQFQVNTYTTDGQRSPSVAADGGGDFVVVWRSSGSNGSDSSETSIQGQRFDSAGASLGDEFQVNTYTTSFQFSPAVAAGVDGEFVVVWESDGSSGSA